MKAPAERRDDSSLRTTVQVRVQPRDDARFNVAREIRYPPWRDSRVGRVNRAFAGFPDSKAGLRPHPLDQGLCDFRRGWHWPTGHYLGAASSEACSRRSRAFSMTDEIRAFCSSERLSRSAAGMSSRAPIASLRLDSQSNDSDGRATRMAS